jgi:hypothetical protein
VLTRIGKSGPPNPPTPPPREPAANGNGAKDGA